MPIGTRVEPEWPDWVTYGEGSEFMAQVDGVPVFKIRKGDRGKALQVLVRSANGAPFDWTGYSVAFYMRARDGSSNKVDGTAGSIVNSPGTDGRITYAPAAADVDTAGLFNAYFKGTSGAGLSVRVPEEGFIRVIIGESFE